MPSYVMTPADIDRLIALLQSRGYLVIGPKIEDGVIGLGDVQSSADLPVGWTDRQEPGHYRLDRRADDAFFGYVVGPHSPKRYLHPATMTVWAGRRHEATFVADDPPEPARYAFLGVRPCELAGIDVQDDVLTGGPFVDPAYAGRRTGCFIAVVECTQPGGTCFCGSMQSGPGAPRPSEGSAGFDLALTELIEPEHRFVVATGSELGREAAGALALATADAAAVDAARRLVEEAAGRMGRHLDTEGLAELLAANLEHPFWDEVAARCLACGNCTLVCPTCFCVTVSDTLELDGASARRVRTWDSCFSEDFSYVHGGPLRASASARYRQWMTHKLSTWVDQFGGFGCVGCGRCLTWCPVGIDITAEAARIRHETMKEVAGVG